MSNLTLGLAVLGGLLLAGVVAHGAWQARRGTLRVARADAPQSTLREAVEPALDTVHADTGESADGIAMLNLPVSASLKPTAMDSLIDAIARIDVDGPVSGDAALAALPLTRRVGSKPFTVEGRNAASGEWESCKAGSIYNGFQAGVQLTNRTGALNDIEFSEFVQKAQAFADAVDGQPSLPEMRDEVSRARELDAFASSHDAQLGFMIRARSIAWSPGYVQQQAIKAGFVPGATAGRLVLPASEAGLPPVLVLAFDTQVALADDPEQSALRELELSLDAPQVTRSEQPFVRMREAAVQLAASMDGLITDAKGAVITREAMDAISADLEQLYDTLDAHDLSAGSLLARRLFS